jgi:hypothetical protein
MCISSLTLGLLPATNKLPEVAKYVPPDAASGSLDAAAYLIFFLALAALIVASILIRYTRYSWTPYSVIRLLGLILILMITLFLTVVPAVDKDTLTQVIGLLAAIGGYLLGKDPREMDVNQTEKLSNKPEKPQKIKSAQKLPGTIKK